MKRSHSRINKAEFRVKQRSKKKGITTITTVLWLVGALGTVGAFMSLMPDGSSSTTSSGVQEAALTEPLRSDELRGLLADAGLNPRSLAVAGATPSQASVLIAAAHVKADEGRQSLRSLKQAMLDAARSASSIRGGEGHSEAQTSAKNARTAYENARDSLLQSAVEGVLTENQINTIRRIKENARFRVPLEYLVTDRTQQEWVRLREALSQKDSLEREMPTGMGIDEGLSPEAKQIIADADAHPAVVAARESITNNLEGVDAAWKQAIQESGN